MSWRMPVIAAQLGVGGGLVFAGLKRATHYGLAGRDAAQKAALEWREGRPLVHRERTVAPALLAILAGIVLLATATTSAEMLADRQVEASQGG